MLWLNQLLDWVQPRAVHIDARGRLIAAVELTSPRNKDRPAARARCLGRYVGYLRQGVNLLLIDVLPWPAGFSFPDALARDLGYAQPPTPCAASYRVGEALPDGTLLASWRRTLFRRIPRRIDPALRHR